MHKTNSIIGSALRHGIFLYRAENKACKSTQKKQVILPAGHFSTVISCNEHSTFSHLFKKSLHYADLADDVIDVSVAGLKFPRETDAAGRRS